MLVLADSFFNEKKLDLASPDTTGQLTDGKFNYMCMLYVVSELTSLLNVCLHRCSLLLTMPAYSEQSDSLGAKLLTLYPNNISKGYSSHQGVILLFDASSGSPQAVCSKRVATLMCV